MQAIRNTDDEYNAPPSALAKWGIQVSKMRRKAFKAYVKNYEFALAIWPEFQIEFDYSRALNDNKKSGPKVKQLPFSWSKEFFKLHLRGSAFNKLHFPDFFKLENKRGR